MPQSYRMLVVDDDDGLREYLQALASSRGFHVFAAPSGEEAIETTLERSRPDLVTPIRVTRHGRSET
jgi:CheY-like chemotaxis protein